MGTRSARYRIDENTSRTLVDKSYSVIHNKKNWSYLSYGENTTQYLQIFWTIQRREYEPLYNKS